MRSRRGRKSSVDQLPPGLALHAAAAPVQLEQHVRVEVRVDLVEVDGDLAHAPERRLGDRDCRSRRGRADGVVGEVEHDLGLALLAQPAGVLADLGDQALARVARRRAGPSRRGPRTRPCSRRRRARRRRRTPCRPGSCARRPNLRLIAAPPTSSGYSQAVRVQLLHAQRHLLGGRDEQRAQADRGGVVLLRGVEDRPDRDLLAEVDDACSRCW